MKNTIELAREAGIAALGDIHLELKDLETLEALVRADEREACAEVCKKIAEGDPSDPNNDLAEYTVYGVAMQCVTAIEARGDT